MIQKLKHIASQTALTLFVTLALGAGLVGCIGLSGCDDESKDGEKSPSTEVTTSAETTTSANESDEKQGDSEGSEGSEGSEDPGKNTNPGAASKDEGKIENSATELPKNSSFTCTFLNVGQGDCAIIQCDGHYMMIDGGDPHASSTVYSYVSKNHITNFDYIVATHDDADHVGGLSGALRAASTNAAFCSVTSSEKDAFQDMVKSLARYNVKLSRPKVGETFQLGSARVQVIAPARTDTKDNDDSLVLRVTYGETSILFTGDASEIEEAEMLHSDFNLESDILKVAHHGSATSSTAPFLDAVNPSFAIISVGKNNTYGHPTNEALSRLDDCGTKIYRTDLQGTITATSDGKTFAMKTQKKAKTSTNVSQSDQKAQDNQGQNEQQYIGNVNSKKFHRPSCNTLPAEKNRVQFKSRDEAISSGYSPCGNCQP